MGRWRRVAAIAEQPRPNWRCCRCTIISAVVTQRGEALVRKRRRQTEVTEALACLQAQIEVRTRTRDDALRMLREEMEEDGV
jgi:hypothetical protein